MPRDQSCCVQTDDPEMTIAKLSALSPAEQAVLDQALTGVTAREIAERLSLSEATVRSHLSSIYVKLGVSGRVALLAHFRGSVTAALSMAATACGMVAHGAWGAYLLSVGAFICALPLAVIVLVAFAQPQLIGGAAVLWLGFLGLDLWIGFMGWRLGKSMDKGPANAP